MAHKQFDAEFTDDAGIGIFGQWDSVPQDVLDEICQRTPGFAAGSRSSGGPTAAGQEILDAIRAESGIESDAEWDVFLNALSLEHGPTAYLFRCRHCGKLGGYSDTN